jgi:DNA replication and repair protein RecF
MFQLTHLSLTQFRNYARRDFVFAERIVGICGKNGTGKTNLLDSIYYLSLTKSYFSRPDAQNVLRGTEGLRVEGNYNISGKSHKVVCIVRENNKKELVVNDEQYKKFSDHIGRYPTVMIAPDDIELMIGPSEARRKYLDTLLSQIDAPYLQHLIAYNKVLQQRNSLLKSNEHGHLDTTLLEVLNNQLVSNGQYIFEKRTEFLKEFLLLPMIILIWCMRAHCNRCLLMCCLHKTFKKTAFCNEPQKGFTEMTLYLPWIKRLLKMKLLKGNAKAYFLRLN